VRANSTCNSPDGPLGLVVDRPAQKYLFARRPFAFYALAQRG
jgi:hypothetical protein